MRTLVCDLALTPETVKAVYGGAVRYVQARSRDGLHVRFPVRWLRPYVSHDGVHGAFALTLDADNKLQQVQRVPSNAR